MSRTHTIRAQAEIPAWIEPLAEALASKLRADLSRQAQATEELASQIRQLAEIQLTTAEAIQRRLTS